MVAVATGGPRIDAVNSEYQERRGRIREALQERRIDDLNGFSDLWRWYAYWGQHLPTYQIAAHIHPQHVQPIETAVESSAQGWARRGFDEPTGWVLVDRQLRAAQDRLNTAENEGRLSGCRAPLLGGNDIGGAGRLRSRPSRTEGRRGSSIGDRRETDDRVVHRARTEPVPVATPCAGWLSPQSMLRNSLQHDRNAEWRDAALLVEATTACVNIVAIIAGVFSPSAALNTSLGGSHTLSL